MKQYANNMVGTEISLCADCDCQIATSINGAKKYICTKPIPEHFSMYGNTDDCAYKRAMYQYKKCEVEAVIHKNRRYSKALFLNEAQLSFQQQLLFNKFDSIEAMLTYDKEALVDMNAHRLYTSIRFTPEFKEALNAYFFANSDVFYDKVDYFSGQIMQFDLHKNDIVAELEQAMRKDVIYLLAMKILEQNYFDGLKKKRFKIGDFTASQVGFPEWNMLEDAVRYFSGKLENQSVDESKIQIFQKIYEDYVNMSIYNAILPFHLYVVYAALIDDPTNSFFKEPDDQVYDDQVYDDQVYDEDLFKLRKSLLPKVKGDVNHTLKYNEFTEFVEDKRWRIRHKNINYYVFNQYSQFYDMLNFGVSFKTQLETAKLQASMELKAESLSADYNLKSNSQRQKEKNRKVFEGLQSYFAISNLIPTFFKYELMNFMLPEKQAAVFEDESIFLSDLYVTKINQLLLAFVDEVCEKMVVSKRHKKKEIEMYYKSEAPEIEKYFENEGGLRVMSSKWLERLLVETDRISFSAPNLSLKGKQGVEENTESVNSYNELNYIFFRLKEKKPRNYFSKNGSLLN